MISALKCMLLGYKRAFACNMAYRTNFFLCLGIVCVAEFFFPVITIIIYSTGASFPGWSLYEVLLIQAVFTLSKGIGFPLFTGMFFNVMHNVISGTLDIYLLKPRPLIFMVIVTAFNALDSSKFLAAIILLVIVVTKLPPSGFLQWTGFLFMLILSVALIFSFFLLMSVYVIRFVGSDRILGLIDPVSQYGLYPNTIFSRPIRFLSSNIIPVALLGYYPAVILLGKKPDGLIFAIISAFAFVFASLILWKKSIGKYTSAGG